VRHVYPFALATCSFLARPDKVEFIHLRTSWFNIISLTTSKPTRLAPPQLPVGDKKTDGAPPPPPPQQKKKKSRAITTTFWDKRRPRQGPPSASAFL
jgi:hypothetical protein